jgi:hypothetical protein
MGVKPASFVILSAAKDLIGQTKKPYPYSIVVGLRPASTTIDIFLNIRKRQAG